MDWAVVSGVLGQLVWPVTTLVIVFLLRRPITRVVSELVVRTRRVSFIGVSLELETLPALAPSWGVAWNPAQAGAVIEDVRQLTSSQVFDSYSSTLFEQLLNPKEADYAVVDIGLGKEWLTSRLYIFSLVLGEVSRLKAFVFLETTRGVRRRFLGISSPRDVRTALARRYPWLEQAFALSYAKQYPEAQADMKGKTTLSASTYLLDASATLSVMHLVRKYIESIQRTTEPPISEVGTYESFQNPMDPKKTVWERGQWIDGERLERDLGGILNYTWCLDSPDLSRRLKVESILRRQAHLVALVDDDRQFVGLVDRYALLSRNRIEQDNYRHVDKEQGGMT